MGRLPSTVGIRRWVCKSVEEELDDALTDSGGTYIPFSRKALMLDRRRRDEADGERRMMGSGRLTGALGLWARVVLFDAAAAAACVALRALNGAASFRT